MRHATRCRTVTMPKSPRKLLVGVGVLVIGLGAIGGCENIRGKRALQSYKASLIARGERLTVEARTPPVSAEATKAAGDLIQAAWRFRDGPILAKGGIATMRFVAPGKSRAAWQEPTLPVDRATNQWSELADELEQNRDLLNQIRSVLNAPAFSFNLNYKQGFSVLLPHLAKLRGVAQRLAAAVVNDLHAGRLEEAAANLNALLRLPEVLRDEPLLISQLVRVALAAIAFAPTWEALQAEGWSDLQ